MAFDDISQHASQLAVGDTVAWYCHRCRIGWGRGYERCVECAPGTVLRMQMVVVVFEYCPRHIVGMVNATRFHIGLQPRAGPQTPVVAQPHSKTEVVFAHCVTVRFVDDALAVFGPQNGVERGEAILDIAWNVYTVNAVGNQTTLVFFLFALLLLFPLATGYKFVALVHRFRQLAVPVVNTVGEVAVECHSFDDPADLGFGQAVAVIEREYLRLAVPSDAQQGADMVIFVG